MGEEYTTIVDFLQHQKPILEELAEFRRQREQASKQREEQTSKGFANFLQQVNDNYRQVNDARAEEYKTPLQDNTALDYNYTGNPTPINPHLARRAEQGAKGHAAWAKEHPVLDAWGNAVGAVPLAVAAAPFVVGAGETAAGTAVGQGITSGLGWLANAARTAPAVARALPWLDAGLTSVFGAHGISKSIEEGGVSPESALEIAPLLQVAKPAVNGINTAITTSSNPKIVTVDGNKITAKKAGTSKLTVTSDNGIIKTFNIKVTKKAVSKLKLKVPKKTVKTGKTIKLKAVITPANKSSNKVYWKSSNKKIATVTQKGIVKGVKKGKVVITAVALDGSGKKKTVRITVK